MTYFATQLFNGLEQLFGTYWVEIVFAIGLVVTCLLAILCICISVKYNKAKTHLTSTADQNTNLRAQVADLEKTLSYVRAHMAEIAETTGAALAEKDNIIEAKDLEIKQLSDKIKRSESAKKAAETRRKNKENK